jgi:hypothetical protein
LVLILAFTELRERSTLEDEFERELELVFSMESALSRLDEEMDKLRLEARLVEMLALTELSDPSTLDEELERLRLDVIFVEMLALTELSDASTLEEELERLKLEV